METGSQSRLGIVLSGGGSRGIAHIGVLRALLEADIAPDQVAGSSAGALVGALYAAGYEPAEMLEFFETRSPFHVSKMSLVKPGIIDTAKVVADFKDYFPENRIETLDKPLRILATDIIHGKPKVFDSGPLIRAVLASCSMPVVFTPTELDGEWFADGGIVDNFPVDLLDGRCRTLLGVYASPLRRVEPSDIGSSFAVLQRALEIGIFTHSRTKFERCDVVICPDELSRFSVFDTKNLKEIEAVGHRAACEVLPEIRRALSGQEVEQG